MDTNTSIPKVIHYCWFGGKPLPDLAKKCIESWKKYLPDYEIKRWDESNFDISLIPYMEEAYSAKKYAFVSDYARLWILYNHGGLYFDTDVEIIKPLDQIIMAGPFMGCERSSSEGDDPHKIGVNPGLGLGALAGQKIYKELLDVYSQLHFRDTNGKLVTKTIVEYTTELLCEHGLRNTSEIQEVVGLKIYPVKYFCPIDYSTGKLTLTPATYTIHHYAESWVSPKSKLIKYMNKYLGRTLMNYLVRFKRKLNFG